MLAVRIDDPFRESCNGLQRFLAKERRSQQAGSGGDELEEHRLDEAGVRRRPEGLPRVPARSKALPARANDIRQMR